MGLFIALLISLASRLGQCNLCSSLFFSARHHYQLASPIRTDGWGMSALEQTCFENFNSEENEKAKQESELFLEWEE